MSASLPAPAIRRLLGRGGVIPAHPLALTSRRRLDERRQRALTRYYLDAGAVGVAVGVHTTQFEIRRPEIGLLRPVLELARDSIDQWSRRPVIRIAGVVGSTRAAVREAAIARDLGYHVVLLSLGGLGSWPNARLLAHARAVAQIMPVMGFYLQPAVGGRILDDAFWRRMVEIENLVAIKVAPFNRYQTVTVARAVAQSGRSREIALYTGNDDAIVADLTGAFEFPVRRARRRVRFVGGLLGQWAVGTRAAVTLTRQCAAAARAGSIPGRLLALGHQLTDTNGAIFDAANGFRGCLPGIHEVLRRQGLLAGRWCLDGSELSRGQMGEIDRVTAAYPHLTDNRFVRARLDRWLS